MDVGFHTEERSRDVRDPRRTASLGLDMLIKTRCTDHVNQQQTQPSQFRLKFCIWELLVLNNYRM